MTERGLHLALSDFKSRRLEQCLACGGHQVNTLVQRHRQENTAPKTDRDQLFQVPKTLRMDVSCLGKDLDKQDHVSPASRRK